MTDTTLSTLHASAKSAVPAGAGLLISVPSGSARAFDELQPSALVGAAGQGFTFRGAWAANTAYAAFDVVTNGGSTYECSTPFTSGSTFNAANWNLWAAKGADGSSGVSGGTITGISIDGSTIAASTASPYQMLTADRVVDVNKTTGAATKLLLPTNPTLWVEYTIIDGKGDAGTNNITITAANGTTINGAASFIANANNDAISLRAVNATTWRIS